MAFSKTEKRLLVEHYADLEDPVHSFNESNHYNYKKIRFLPCLDVTISQSSVGLDNFILSDSYNIIRFYFQRKCTLHFIRMYMTVFVSVFGFVSAASSVGILS